MSLQKNRPSVNNLHQSLINKKFSITKQNAGLEITFKKRKKKNIST